MTFLHQRITNALFEDPALDGASMDELLLQLDTLRPEHECLFRGELSEGMEFVAPYLVRVVEGTRFYFWLLEEGWGKHFGVFALADATLLPMRLHFRKNLRVYTESGDPKLFRFYDPRVLRVFAPTLLPADADTFFGPVARFFCEGDTPEVLESFSRRGGDILHRRLNLQPGAEWKTLEQSLPSSD